MLLYIEPAWRLLRRATAHALAQFRKPAGGPLGRLRRRYVALASLFFLAGWVIAFPAKVASGAHNLCSAKLMPHSVPDLCARLGVPGIPRVDERQAWEAVPPGNCEALNIFVQKFPNRVLAEHAKTLLARRRQVESSKLKASPEHGYVRDKDAGFDSERAARIDLDARLPADARQTCENTLGGPILEAVVIRSTPQCSTIGGKSYCSASYDVQCTSSSHQLRDVCD